MWTYECVGGSRDGGVVHLRTPIRRGIVVPLSDETSTEHYRLEGDGKLHFSHVGVVASSERLQPILPELQGLLEELAGTLQKIDRLVDGAGSGLPPFPLGRWELQRR